MNPILSIEDDLLVINDGSRFVRTQLKTDKSLLKVLVPFSF